MLKEMYKKREKFAWWSLGVLLATFTVLSIFWKPVTKIQWLDMAYFLLPVSFLVIVILWSRSHYNKVKDITIPQSENSLFDVKDIVIKKDTAITPRLLLFEKNGSYLGKVDMASVPWWMYPLLLAVKSDIIWFFPMTYTVVDGKGNKQLEFRKTGGFKQTKLEIFNGNEEPIGTYIQEELKALWSIKGTLYDNNQQVVLPIKASGFSGSFSWQDGEGKRWAYFYNGIFPHEYTKLFRDSHNEIVELSEDLSEQNKSRMLAIIGFLFLSRIQSSK